MKFVKFLLSAVVSWVVVSASFGDVDMTTFPNTSGYTVIGPYSSSNFVGRTIGDVNGDGLHDIICGWGGTPLGRSAAGIYYVMFGKSGASLTTVQSSAFATGSDGFFIYGAAANDMYWMTVFTTAGDVNNDGYDDIMIGHAAADFTGRNDCGIMYIIFGHSTATSFPTIDLLGFTASGGQGFRIIGPSAGQTYAGYGEAAGDVNGDGFDDMLLGSREQNAYLVFGKASWASDIDLASPPTGYGFKIEGYWLGLHRVAGIGDFNNDGYDDMAFGFDGQSYLDRWAAGYIYVVFGHSNATAFNTLSLGSWPQGGTTGFTIYGADGADSIGNTISTAGDFNGDGLDDIMLGTPGADYGRGDAGAVYVIFGTKGQTTFPLIDLRSFDWGTKGFKVYGATANAYLGNAVRPAGDINGDGISDILVSAPRDDIGRTDGGTAYVFYGHRNTTSFATIDTLTFTSGALGFRILGPVSGEWFSEVVSEGGDINGDGTDDIILTTYRASSNTGKVQVFYGIAGPSVAPTTRPTTVPTMLPTDAPTFEPSRAPTYQPTAAPTGPTSQPSSAPSAQPSAQPSVSQATYELMRSSPTYTVRNGFAFAAVTANNSVHAWGEAPHGGDSTAVQHLLTANVSTVVHSRFAFVALKVDGSLVSWGVTAATRGAVAYTVDTHPASFLVANEAAFAGVSSLNGAVLAFGSVHHGGDVQDNSKCNGYSQQLSSGVHSLVASAGAFAALKTDGSLYVWGNKHAGGDVSSAVLSSARGTTLVVATRGAFAALLRSGRVVAWGDPLGGGDTSTASGLVTEVVHIIASNSVFVAFRKDSSLVVWGYHKFGGDTSAVDSQLTANVTFVAKSTTAFAALKSDGTVTAWGNADGGGDASAVQGTLTDMVSVVGNSRAFAAINEAGRVITWGKAAYGGQIPSNKVSALSSGVVSIYHTDRAFAALKDDGSVVVWGQAGHGGSPGAAVEAHLVSGVHTICANDAAFSVIKTDGKVVGWGHPVSVPTAGVLFTSDQLVSPAKCA